MYLSTIKLHRFRNLKDLSLEFSPQINLIVGQNGQGKTNLVESICFLSTSRSFRGAKTEDLQGWACEDDCFDGFSVFGRIVDCTGPFSLGISVQNKKKQILLDGNPFKNISNFLGKFLSVSFSPFDLSLVRGEPGGRRRFVDRYISDLVPGYADSLMRYNRALEHKLGLLKEGCSEEMIQEWNWLMAHESEIILKNRIEFVRSLSEAGNSLLSDIAPSDGRLFLSVKSNIAHREPLRERSSEEIYHLLEKEAKREIYQRSCILGPHRDDIFIQVNGYEAKSFASQGQVRSIVIALKLAVVSLIEQSKGDSPVILLDDFDSELDNFRKGRIFSLLFEEGRQVFMTTTDRSLEGFLPQGSLQLFEVTSGQVNLAKN